MQGAAQPGAAPAHGASAGPGRRRAVRPTPRPVRGVGLNRFGWLSLGFVAGVAFWHFVGFWGFVSEAVFKSERAAHSASRPLPVAREPREAALPQAMAQGARADAEPAAPEGCSVLHLDRASARTYATACDAAALTEAAAKRWSQALPTAPREPGVASWTAVADERAGPTPP